MNEKPRLSFWQIWNMSFGFLGIQFGWGLQMANMSAIYQFLGADEGDIPILWLAAPLTGLLVQPFVGYFSDRTWSPRFGRRRPYFFVGALLASIALILMPMSSALWMAAGLLWILDASVNVSMEPFRAFVGDMLPPKQRKTGFAMQSLLIGLGAVLSSALPFILTNGFGVEKEATSDSPIPPAVKLAFFIGAGVFFAAVMVTILTTKEYPPEDLEAFEKKKRETAGLGNAFAEIFQGIGSMPTAMKQLAGVQFFTWLGLFCMWIYFVPAVGKKVFDGKPLGESDQKLSMSDVHRSKALAELYQSEKERIAGEMKAEGKGFSEKMLQMFGLKPADPDPGEKIDVAALTVMLEKADGDSVERDEKDSENPMLQSFSMAMVRSGGDDAKAAEMIHEDLAAARRYQEGTAWGGVCFSAYNLVAFLFAFMLIALARVLAAKKIHLVCLTVGAVGLISAAFVGSPGMLLVSMIGVGVAWASILSMPYAMLANVIPGDKMGFYMGVFNFFIVLPQIIASVGLGVLVAGPLGGDAMKAVLAGGVCFAIAAAATLLVGNESETGVSTAD
ncbi:MFS transporter [Haloferula sp.]|uniref:MFS transporter n=1 Tax=Haloferula sp. TaxID=2497595 RepID=UPI00329D2B45